MNNKKLATFCLFLCTAVASRGQNLDESLLFSQYEQGATARFKAMGNAQTALGGDISNIAGNPAGLGFFSNSDISLSLDYFGDKNKATYFGSQTESTRDRFGLNQLGIVFNMPSMRARGANLDQGWLNFNIGISYNKTNSFISNLNYSGQNNESTIADYMADPRTGVAHDFGWDAGLVDIGADNLYFPMGVPNNTQRSFTQTKGSQSETNLSFGANYSNKLYLGASVAFSSIDQRSYRRFEEDGYLYAAEDNVVDAGSRFLNPQQGSNDPRFYNELLNSDYYYDDDFEGHTRGAGVNVKLGLIYRPTDIIRIGLSATTPTWYNMSTDYSDYYGITNFHPETGAEISWYEYEPEYNSYDYNLRTPYRVNGGISAVFSKGLISADVEFINYKSMKITTDIADLDMSYAEDIKNTYKGAVNLKVGGEYVVTPQFMVRAGYNHTGNPYENIDYKAQSITGGIGFRFGNYYVDATYQNWRQEYDTTPYALADDYYVSSPIASVKNTRNNVFLTLGAKF